MKTRLDEETKMILEMAPVAVLWGVYAPPQTIQGGGRHAMLYTAWAMRLARYRT